MTGSARTVHVYYADRAQLPEAIVAAHVTAADRRRLASTMSARRRSEYLAGRALLRYALAREIGASAATMHIEPTRDGKPECVAGPAVSVSHSGDLVVCAVAGAGPGAIGIDAEATQPRAAQAIAERYFTPAEARWIGADAVRFRMLWVLKEAYLKVLGVGLAGGLASLECRIEPPAIVAHAANDAAVPQLALLAGRGCYVAVAAADTLPFALAVERVAPAATPDAFGPFTVIAATT